VHQPVREVLDRVEREHAADHAKKAEAAPVEEERDAHVGEDLGEERHRDGHVALLHGGADGRSRTLPGVLAVVDAERTGEQHDEHVPGDGDDAQPEPVQIRVHGHRAEVHAQVVVGRGLRAHRAEEHERRKVEEEAEQQPRYCDVAHHLLGAPADLGERGEAHVSESGTRRVRQAVSGKVRVLEPRQAAPPLG
jgi:hypothetical protein